jgi:hypothetical protein
VGKRDNWFCAEGKHDASISRILVDHCQVGYSQRRLARERRMTKPIERDAMYRKRAFDGVVVELCVRWYLS